MLHKDAKNKAMESIQVSSMKKELQNLHVKTIHPVVAKIHETCLNNPHKKVGEVLKSANVSYNQYRNLSKIHLNINDVRKEVLGSSYIYTQEKREELGARLNKKRGAEPKDKSSAKKKRTSQKMGGGNEGEFDVTKFMAETYGNRTMVAGNPASQ
jgi:hypothetical protein